MTKGIDVSSHQGNVNWLEVKRSGQEFAIARASIGQGTKDDLFIQNYQRIVARGMIPGAYHLVTGTSSGAAQAANFKDSLDRAGYDKGMLVLDVEGWSETVGKEAETLAATEYLCDWIRATYNITPIIYTGVFWRENLKQHPNNFGSELWLSYYGTNDVGLYIPTAWKSKGLKIWQYTEKGTVSGVTGPVDLNIGVGSVRSFKELAGWEWDELATQEEIRAVVASEVEKVATRLEVALSNESDSTLSQVQTALRDVEIRLGHDIRANVPVLTRDEILDKFSEVLVAVADVGDDVDDAVALADLAGMVETLHRHVCTKVHLHT